MPRFALLLIAALALLFGATAAQAAPVAPAAAPTASAAEDLHDELLDDECAVDEDACLEEDWSDEDLACEDDLWDDEGWADEDDEAISDDETYVDDVEAAAATDDECLEDDELVAPELTALSASVVGEDARLTVQVAFRLDEPGPVELTLARVGAVASKRAKVACPSGTAAKAKKGKGKAKGKKCGASLGRVTVAGRAGANRVELRGRWRGKKLAPGSYRLTATPKAAGATSDTATFKIAA